MKVVAQIDWSAAETLAQRTVFQVREGGVFFRFDALVPDDDTDGIEFGYPAVFVREAGTVIRHRAANNNRCTFTRNTY